MTKTLALIGALAAGTSAMAVPITGSINFTGNATPDNTDLSLATSVGSIVANDAIVTGDFLSLPNLFIFGANHVILSTLTYNDFAVTTGPVSYTPLWEVDAVTTIASPDASFDLLNISSVNVTGASGAQTLTMYGTGMLHLEGYDDTVGNWVFSLNSANSGEFTFTTANAAQVPDGGTTAMLLGVGMVALGALRRKA